jgi:PAS domain S-box-containing protein
MSCVQRDLHEHNLRLRNDLLELGRIERALRFSEERFDLAVRGSSDGLWDWDIASDKVWYSPRFKELIGFTDGECSETFGFWEKLLHPEDREPTLRALQDHLDVDRPFDVQYRLKTQLAGYRWFWARGIAMRDHYGHAVRMAGSIQDITERKRIEQEILILNNSLEQRVQERTQELERRTRELEAKNAELDQFTYVASHDLQEPLRKLVSFSQLLEQDIGGELNSLAKQDLFYITDAARRMQKLVQDLLAYSRFGRSAMKWEYIRLQDCVSCALDILAPRIAATKAKITCDTLPSIYGDATMLTQLYQNLIGNALKFVRHETPTIHITAVCQDDLWTFGVRDNGIGIDRDYLEQIFAPFQRLHGPGEYEGTGIGLAICQKSVDRHGGKIWVESELGRGSHFQFTLPTTADPPREDENYAA